MADDGTTIYSFYNVHDVFWEYYKMLYVTINGQIFNVNKQVSKLLWHKKNEPTSGWAAFGKRRGSDSNSAHHTTASLIIFLEHQHPECFNPCFKTASGDSYSCR